jgi:hypothetical protein
MNRSATLIRIGSITGAVLLVGVFVSYRAGAFDRIVQPTPPADPQPVTNVEAPAEPSATPEQLNPILISGSKSAAVVFPAPSGSPKYPADAPPPSPTPPAAPPAIIGGSKSLAPLIPPKSGAPTQQVPKSGGK